MFDLSRFYDFFYSAGRSAKTYFGDFFGFWHVRIYSAVLVLLNLCLWFSAIFIKNHVSQDLIVLHYNVNFGVDLIGNVNQIFVVPILGLIIIVLNSLLAAFFLKHEHFKFVAHLLLAACFLANLFLLVALATVYLINFR